MTFKQIKDQKIQEVLDRMFNAVFTNYAGGEVIEVDNYTIIKGNENLGQTTCIDQMFSLKELTFIEKENILDLIRKEGWEVIALTNRSTNPLDIAWVFKPAKQ